MSPVKLLSWYFLYLKHWTYLSLRLIHLIQAFREYSLLIWANSVTASLFFSLCKIVLLKSLAWPNILSKSLNYKTWIIWKKSDIKYVQEVAMKMLIVGPKVGPDLVYWLSEEVSLKLRLESWLAVIPNPGFTSELSGGAFKKMYVWGALPRNLTSMS